MWWWWWWIGEKMLARLAAVVSMTRAPVVCLSANYSMCATSAAEFVQHFSASLLPPLRVEVPLLSNHCLETRAGKLQTTKQRLLFSPLYFVQQKHETTEAMSAAGTLRGTPKGASKLPTFQNASAIPRPALETVAQSDAGASTLSASRQKQSKRDEVRSPF